MGFACSLHSIMQKICITVEHITQLGSGVTCTDQFPLQWRHNVRDSVSNHWRLNCLKTKRLSHTADLFSMSITEAFILASTYVMRPPWALHRFPWAKQWYPSSCNKSRLNCHLTNFLEYILREVLYFVLVKFQSVLAYYQILHLSFVHLGSKYWYHYWQILSHPASVIRSNMMKVELLAFLHHHSEDRLHFLFSQ